MRAYVVEKDAILHNLDYLLGKAGTTPVWAVLKGNGYGLGLVPMAELCQVFGQQLKQQLSRESLSAMVSYNVRTQNAWYFRAIPWKIKSTLMRIGYRFFGESNSSLTLTNLGLVKLPEELLPHVENIQCWLTPRVSSPYGCSVLSFGDKITLTMSYYGDEDKVSPIFFEKLQNLMRE